MLCKFYIEGEEQQQKYMMAAAMMMRMMMMLRCTQGEQNEFYAFVNFLCSLCEYVYEFNIARHECF